MGTGRADYTVRLVDEQGEADLSVAVVGDQVVDLTGATTGEVLTVQSDGTVAPQAVDTSALDTSGMATDAELAAEAAARVTDDGLKVDKSTLDANSVLAAITDDTPVALAVPASTVVGRKASGSIAALTGAEVAALIPTGTYVDGAVKNSVRLGPPSGADDGPTITAAIAAVVAACQADGTQVCEVVFPYKYVVSTALTQGGANKCNSQIPLPYIEPTLNQKVVLILRGAAPSHWPMYGQTVKQTSTSVIRSTLTGAAYDATNGIPSVIGGGTLERVEDSRRFSNMQLVIRNLQVRCPDNPSLTGVNAAMVAEIDWDGLACDTDTIAGAAMANGLNMAAVSQPTHPAAIGAITPQDGNNTMQRIGSFSCIGFYGGLAPNEHLNVKDFTAWRCFSAFAFLRQGGGHAQTYQNVSAEWCPYVMSGVNATTGIASVPGVHVLKIENLDIEDMTHGSDWATPVEHIHDPTSVLHGAITHRRAQEGAGLIYELLLNGASFLRLTPLRIPYAQSISPFWVVPRASLHSAEAAPSAWYAANWDICNLFDIPAFRRYRYAILDIGVSSGNIEITVVRFTAFGNTAAYVRHVTSGVIACPATGVQGIDLGVFDMYPNKYGWGLSLWSSGTTFTCRHGNSSGVQAIRGSQTLVAPNVAGVPASGNALGYGTRYVSGFCLEGDSAS